MDVQIYFQTEITFWGFGCRIIELQVQNEKAAIFLEMAIKTKGQSGKR